MQKYEVVLARIAKAYESITEYKREVSELVPRHQAALERVKELVDNVETQREDYIQVCSTNLNFIIIILFKVSVTIQGGGGVGMFMCLFEKSYKDKMYKSTYQNICHTHKNTIPRV